MIEALPSFETTVNAADAASAVIRGYCRWHIWPSMTETLVLDGPGANRWDYYGTNVLMLPTLKLTSVVSLSETQWRPGSVPVALNVLTDIDWSEAGIVWHVNRRGWTTKPRGITIVIVHGYQYIPAEIGQLAATLAARASSNPTRLKRMQVGMRSEEYAAAGLLADEMAVLDPYRRVI